MNSQPPAGLRRRVRLLRVVAAIAAAAIVVGCNQQSGARPTPTATPVSPAALEPGWSLLTDRGAGFALALPDHWEYAQRDSPTVAADIAAITARSPGIGAYFKTGLAAADTRLKFVAADPSSLGLGFLTNAAVFRGELGRADTAADLAGVTGAKIKALGKDIAVSAPIESKRVRLAGMDAQRLAYVFKTGGKSVAVVSYLLLTDVGRDRIEYELILGSAGTDYAPLFDRISFSFRVLPQTAPATASPSR